MFYVLVNKLDLQSVQHGTTIRSFDLIKRVRKILDLEHQILTAIYGIDLKAEKNVVRGGQPQVN